VPAHFGDPAAEYHQARARAAVFDLSHCGQVEAAGKDAASFLHNLCTNEVNKLQVGEGREAFLTTGQAKIVGHALIERVRLGDGREVYWLTVAPGWGEKTLKHL